MSNSADVAATLRFKAHIADVVIEGRKANNLSFDELVETRNRLRTQADLIEQGVPVEKVMG